MSAELILINWLLDFCCGCGIMLEEKAPDGLPDLPKICPNCRLDVSRRSARCQGVFSHTDAMLLRKALGHEH